MATAGAVLGLAVPGVVVDDIAARPRPCRTSRACGRPARRIARRTWQVLRIAGKNLDEDDVRVRPNRRGTRPRSKHRPSARGRQCRAWCSPSTAAGTGSWSTAPRSSRCGRASSAARASWSATGSTVVGDLSGDRTRWPASCARPGATRCCGAPPTTPTRYRAGHRGQRRPAGHRHRAGRPAAALRLHRPLPGRRARRGASTRCWCLTKSDLAVGRRRCWRRTARSTCRRWSPRAAATSTEPARAAARPGLRVRRALRRRQVDADQRAGPGRAAGHRRRQRAIGSGRHTSTSALALPLPGGGLGDRHPGVRSFGLAHVSAADLLWAFPDLEDGADECPPRLRAPDERGRVHAGRLGGRGPLRPRAAGGLRRLLSRKRRGRRDDERLRTIPRSAGSQPAAELVERAAGRPLSPAKDIRMNRPPSTGSKSTPGATATPVSSSSRSAPASESSVHWTRRRRRRTRRRPARERSRPIAGSRRSNSVAVGRDSAATFASRSA